VFLVLLLQLLGLAGCAAGWGTHYVYAPYDQRRLVDAEVTVTRPIVTTRPDAADTPWGRQADRVGAVVTERFDGPFVSAELADLADLGWTEESWKSLDQVADAVLTQAANPLPHEQLRIGEGTPQATEDDLGRDGYVLLVAIQPSMKETFARLTGASGEVVRFAGYAVALAGSIAGGADADPEYQQKLEQEEQRVQERQVGKRHGKRKAKKSKRALLMGRQNRVDVALLLVDRYSGRFVAAHGARLEPATRPCGGYLGAVERALRDWRIVPEPWVSELLQP